MNNDECKAHWIRKDYLHIECSRCGYVKPGGLYIDMLNSDRMFIEAIIGKCRNCGSIMDLEESCK